MDELQHGGTIFFLDAAGVGATFFRNCSPDPSSPIDVGPYRIVTYIQNLENGVRFRWGDGLDIMAVYRRDEYLNDLCRILRMI